MNVENERFDMNEFIESFRQALSSPDASNPSLLIEMMTKYSSLSDEANRCLRECNSLSLKGLYANAVSLAEREPNLLERCSALEIPERDILATVATALGINAPTLPNRDLVESLQETYQKGASAESNVKRLHRLTLARAPLPARLSIMRRLQIQDPDRPFIDVDIRNFEKAWFKRALDFAQPYAKTGDVDVVEEILNDLLENGYVETPPQSLISSLQSLLEKTQSMQLPALADEIQQAYRDGAVDVLTVLAGKWKELVSKSGIKDATSRYNVSEAFTWLNRKLSDERRLADQATTRARLVDLLANPKAKRTDVETAFQTALMSKATDADLEINFQNWLQRFSQRKNTIVRNLTAAVVIMVAVIGIGVLTRPFLSTPESSEDKKKETNSLQGIADIIEPKPGEQFKKDPEVKKHSEEFENALAALKSASLKEAPDELVVAARKLARDDTDRKRVDDLLAELKQRQDALKATQRKYFDKQVVKLSSEADQWVSRSKDGFNNAEQAKSSAEYLQQIAELREFAKKHGLDVAPLNTIEKKFGQNNLAMTANPPNSLEKTKPLKPSENSAPRRTSENPSAPRPSENSIQSRPSEAFASKLEQFTSQMSAVPATEESLKKTAEFLSTTLAMAHPEDKTKQRANAAPHDLVIWLKMLELEELIRSGRIDSQTQKAWKGKPPAVAVGKELDLTEMLLQREFSRSGSEAFKLKARLQAPDIKDVFVVRMASPEPYRCWYTKEKLEAGEELIDCNVITGSDGGTFKRRLQGKRSAAVASPQSQLLSQLEKLWTEKYEPDQWHRKLAEAHDQLADEPDIEPLLKLPLMRMFLGLAVKSSIGYAEVLTSKGFKSIVSPMGHIEGNWFDPNNNLSVQREKAKKLCNEAPRLIELAEDAARRDNLELKNAKEGVHLVGLLKRNERGQAAIANFLNVDLFLESQLYVVAEENWIPVGSFNIDKQLKLDAIATEFIGWPVFSIRIIR